NLAVLDDAVFDDVVIDDVPFGRLDEALCYPLRIRNPVAALAFADVVARNEEPAQPDPTRIGLIGREHLDECGEVDFRREVEAAVARSPTQRFQRNKPSLARWTG